MFYLQKLNNPLFGHILTDVTFSITLTIYIQFSSLNVDADSVIAKIIILVVSVMVISCNY